MKTIGLLGGTSWLSTIDYYVTLNRMVAEKLGGFHSAQIILKSIDYHNIKSCYAKDWNKVAPLLEKEITEYYEKFRVSNDLIELRNLVLTAHLIVNSAQRRHESRGLHFSKDYPNTLPRALDTVLHPNSPT